MAWDKKPPSVKELVPEAAKDAGSFVRSHSDPVLLVVGYERGSESSSDRTVRLDESTSGEVRGLNAAHVLIVKKRNSLGADKILLGRGRENDVVLPFKSVSRLHAFLRAGADGAWTIEDAGSAYGTYVRDARLTSGHVRALGDGTPVRFGGIEAVFFTASGLYEFLRKLGQASGATPG
jgi:pSer/pThr/pTyr-binding forkhead associated (FHA) protein